MTHDIFNVVTKDPQKQHVTDDVEKTAVHEHGSKHRKQESWEQPNLAGNHLVEVEKLASWDDGIGLEKLRQQTKRGQVQLKEEDGHIDCNDGLQHKWL
ncbi:MAG: hypothetical protein AAF974_10575 [Cyanobacteria bacterium P01_E01_bin.34]